MDSSGGDAHLARAACGVERDGDARGRGDDADGSGMYLDSEGTPMDMAKCCIGVRAPPLDPGAPPSPGDDGDPPWPRAICLPRIVPGEVGDGAAPGDEGEKRGGGSAAADGGSTPAGAKE